MFFFFYTWQRHLLTLRIGTDSALSPSHQSEQIINVCVHQVKTVIEGVEIHLVETWALTWTLESSLGFFPGFSDERGSFSSQPSAYSPLIWPKVSPPALLAWPLFSSQTNLRNRSHIYPNTSERQETGLPGSCLTGLVDWLVTWLFGSRDEKTVRSWKYIHKTTRVRFFLFIFY